MVVSMRKGGMCVRSTVNKKNRNQRVEMANRKTIGPMNCVN